MSTKTVKMLARIQIAFGCILCVVSLAAFAIYWSLIGQVPLQATMNSCIRVIQDSQRLTRETTASLTASAQELVESAEMASQGANSMADSAHWWNTWFGIRISKTVALGEQSLRHAANAAHISASGLRIKTVPALQEWASSSSVALDNSVDVCRGIRDAAQKINGAIVLLLSCVFCLSLIIFLNGLGLKALAQGSNGDVTL